MTKTLITLALMCAGLQAQVTGASIANDEPSVIGSTSSVKPVIEWNRTLLVILRLPALSLPQFIRLEALPFCMLPSLTRSTTSTEPTDRTWSASRTSRGSLHNPLRRTKRRMTSWSLSARRFRRRSTPNFSRTWGRFRRDGTRRKASPSDKPLPRKF